MKIVAQRLERKGQGTISYRRVTSKLYLYQSYKSWFVGKCICVKSHSVLLNSILANGVRNHLRAERKEDKRNELIEKQKREKRKSILMEGTQRMVPAELQELRLLSSLGNKTLSQVFSCTSSMSSRHGSITERESIILPSLQESTSTDTGNIHSARTFSLPVTSGVSGGKNLGAKPRQKTGGSLSL